MDITYRMNTRAVDIEVEGNMLVPDGENRVMLVKVAKGTKPIELLKFR